MTDLDRYARQMILPECGKAGQAQLAQAHVLIIGAGGLGCPALTYLVGAGIGRITLVDGDVIAQSNLHRQTLYREDQIGQFKAEAAKANLKALNPDCEITACVTQLDAENVSSLIADIDIVLDCADNFATSYILSDACLAQNKPLISASALGFSGYVGGFCGHAPSLRAVFPNLPDRAGNCSTAGVFGPVVGTIGCLQAQMTLSHLLALCPSPLGQLITLDCKTFRFGGFRFDQAAEPDGPLWHFISPSSLKDNDFIVDLRGIDEAPSAVTSTAHRFIVDDFTPSGPCPQADQRAVLVCRSGLRAWQAAQKLRAYWPGEISLIAVGDTPLFS